MYRFGGLKIKESKKKNISGRHGEAVGEEQGGHLHVRSEHHCRGAQVHPESNTGTMYTTTYTINTNTCTVLYCTVLYCTVLYCTVLT